LVVTPAKLNSTLDIDHNDQIQLNHMDNKQMYEIHV
jgi:hypothetical protein